MTEGEFARLLVAAAGASLISALLWFRRRQFERYAIRAVIYDLMALADPPDWAHEGPEAVASALRLITVEP